MSDEVKSMNLALAMLFKKDGEALPTSISKIQYLESWVRAIIRDEMKPKVSEQIAKMQAQAGPHGRGSNGSAY